MKNALFYFCITLPAISGTPFQYNIYQGTRENSYSGAEPRQRNKNWCAYVTQKNVSCAVLGDTESVLQPELVPCPPELPNCPQQLVYRTHYRPVYKVGFKVVSELEWRCCPGYQGYDCKEVKDMSFLPVERPPAHSSGHHVPAPQGPHRGAGHPWAGNEHYPNHAGYNPSLVRPGSQNAQHMEEEVQRLSQMVLDMQARMTDMSSSLRVDFQEDASKMLVSLLNDLKQPASARGSNTQTLPLQGFSFEVDTPLMGDVMNRINQVSGDLEFNSNALEDLLERVNRHDGQIRLLVETAEKPPPATPPAHDLRPYVDEKIRVLREELMEGMDIKMADLKNSCDYKMMSVQEQCEGQEAHYLSLTELMDSKESDLRQEIQELKSKLEGDGPGPSGGTSSLPDSVVARVEKMERCLNISGKALSEKCVSLTGHFSKDQSQAFEELKRTVEGKLASMQEELGSLVENTRANSLGHNATSKPDLGQDIAGLDSRMAVVEGLCDKLEPMSSSLQRIKDGLNKHITSLWTCVNQMNGTMRSQSRDLGQLRQSLQNALSEVSGDLDIPKNTVDSVAGPPQAGPPQAGGGPAGGRSLPKVTVMETGEAGPPGRMSSSQVSINFKASPAKSSEMGKTVVPIDSVGKMAFSAGLTLTPFLGDIGIIRFNKVLVNDGGHYDPHTGIFQAPTQGRYLVSAVLSPQRGDKVEAVLSVSNHSVQKLDSTGFLSGAAAPHGQCNCSSAASLSLVLPLKAGDRLGLVLTAGRLAISASSEILSSFSAVLLYASPDER